MSSSPEEEKCDRYKEQLRSSFPKSLAKDIEVVFGIMPFQQNEVKPSYGLSYEVDYLIHPQGLTVLLNGEYLTIPRRVYFQEPTAEQKIKLTDTQKTILSCIYLRHCNGYLRQKRLEEVLDKKEYWVIPFTLHLLGEYVFEILEVLDKHINEKHVDNYVRFVEENPKYWQQTESTMISYWNEYYRLKFPRLKDYLGRHLVDRIKNQAIIANGRLVVE
jgi:hypothetical protein